MELSINNIYKKLNLWLILVLSVQLDCVIGKGFNQFGDRADEKLRLCFVEGRGTYKKAGKFCPTLEAKSNIECVVGLDQLDCLRRINKGAAHFGVFSAEDLKAAQWAGIDVLITSELRFNNAAPFEYELVAIVADDAGIHTVQDLRGSRFCHPGHGLKNHWTDILANYFESTLVSRGCEDDLTLTESRIKASANFFGPSCKPGPWVLDPVQDSLLKRKYPSLCSICYNPQSCSKTDKHWGRLGPLYCITSGEGDVAWVRLDDVRAHFGLTGLPAEADHKLYKFLCPDGHLQPLDTKSPCVWVAQPWPAVAAKREYAAHIQTLVDGLSHDDLQSWQNALLNLMESYHVTIVPLDVTIPIDNYLEQAVGYTSAYSFSTCNPPRSIVYCTTSLIQHSKCSWLQDAASVYGIEPNIQCVRTESIEQCLEDTEYENADLVFVEDHDRMKAELMYHLKPLLYEYAKPLSGRYTIVAVVRSDSEIYNFKDVYGKQACFPSYEGAAFLSALETINNYTTKSENERNFNVNELLNFFSPDSCTWGPDDQGQCEEKYMYDEGALRCLIEGKGQVAFMDMSVFKQFIDKSLNQSWAQENHSMYKLICPFGRTTMNNADQMCYLHWSTRGQIMIYNQTQLIRRNEIYNALRDMDRLFGKYYESHIIPFSLFGPYDRQKDVMFHESTEALRGLAELEKDRMPRLLEPTYDRYKRAIALHSPSSSSSRQFNNSLLLFLIVLKLVS